MGIRDPGGGQGGTTRKSLKRYSNLRFLGNKIPTPKNNHHSPHDAFYFGDELKAPFTILHQQLPQGGKRKCCIAHNTTRSLDLRNLSYGWRGFEKTPSFFPFRKTRHRKKSGRTCFNFSFEEYFEHLAIHGRLDVGEPEALVGVHGLILLNNRLRNPFKLIKITSLINFSITVLTNS